jgi:type 1 glutamine amidotransferase
MRRKCWLLAAGLWALLAAVAVAANPPMKALIVDGQNGHNWKATTPVLKKDLEETGLFKVDVATSPPKGKDMSGFRPKFADYDVVVSNYQGDEWPEETKKALVDYVKGGGGLVIYHFACAAFPKWKEYNEMTGLGGWGGRNEKSGPYVRWRDGKAVRDYSPGRGGGHGPAQPFQIVVRDPDHPITKGLPPKFMHVKDELYGWLRGPAKNLTVLATAFAPKEKGGSGENEPLLFTVQYGKGRVFFEALGHAPEQLKSVAFIVTLQRGAEWAATGKVTQKVPKDFPTADKASVRE